MAKRLSDIYDRLQREIVSGRLVPGQRLREERLAQRLGASRTPVREALARLESDGLVVLRPNRGAVVRDYSPNEVLGIYDLRLRVEGYAAHRAAVHLTDEEIDSLVALHQMQLELNHEIESLQGGAHEQSIQRFIELNQEFHRTIHVGSRNPHVESILARLSYVPLIYQAVHLQGSEGRAVSLQHHNQLIASFSKRDGEFAETIMRTHIYHGRQTVLRRLEEMDASKNGCRDIDVGHRRPS